MKYPAYDQFPEPQANLVDAYMWHVAIAEPRGRAVFQPGGEVTPWRASRFIGSACVQFAKGSDRLAEERLDRAVTAMQPIVDDQEQKGWQAHKRRANAQFLIHLATMLHNHTQPDAASTFQKEMHALAVENAAHATERTLDRSITLYARQIHGGIRSENNQLGLLTRTASPWTLTVPGLVQREQGRDDSLNYDFLVVEGELSSNKTHVTEVQAKADCIGLCLPEGQKLEKREGLKDMDDYANSIVLISDCCDIQGSESNGAKARGITTMLQREFYDLASPDKVRELDDISGSLMLSITTGAERRRGRLGRS